MTQENHQEWVLANERARKIRRAAGVARFNGWVSAILAACCAPFAVLSFGLTNLLAILGLSIVAYNEFRGRERLLRFDPSAAALLGWNQIGLLTMIVLYCVWMLYSSLTSIDSVMAQVQGALGVTNEIDPRTIREYLTMSILLLYGLVIVLSAIFQGLNALYYFTRRRHVEAYLRETPKWVVDLQRTTAPSYSSRSA